MRSAVLFSILALAINFCEAKKFKNPSTDNVASLPKRGGGMIDHRNVENLECGDTFDFGEGSAVAIQTPNYPDNYPNGRQSRCGWFIDVPAGVELSLFCETFDVKRRDKFCITDYNNVEYRCYYGTLDEPMEFPFTFYPSRHENSIYMKFRANRRKNAGGFRWVGHKKDHGINHDFFKMHIVFEWHDSDHLRAYRGDNNRGASNNYGPGNNSSSGHNSGSSHNNN